MTVHPGGPAEEPSTPEALASAVPSIPTRRDLGRLSIVTDGIEQENDLSERVERIIDERAPDFLEKYVALSNSEKFNRTLEGDRPLGQRQTFVRAMYDLIHAHAEPFWQSGSGKRVFSPVPEAAVRLMTPYYFREIAYRPTSELGLRRRFKPTAVRVANHFPEVHFADRLRTMLQQELSDSNLQTQAANDLLTILGMALDSATREK